MEDFSADIMAWASETQDWIGETISNEARVLFSTVVNLSPRQGIAPYSTGHFIHNWKIGPTPTYSEYSGTATSSQKIGEIKNLISDDYFFIYPSVFFTNATSYANQVEMDGWVRTGPYSPVQKAFGGFGAPVTKALASII